MTNLLSSIVENARQVIDNTQDRLFNGNLRTLGRLRAGERVGRGSVSLRFAHSDCFVLKFKTPLWSYREMFEGPAPITKEDFLKIVTEYMETKLSCYINTPKYHCERLFGIIPKRVTGVFYYNGGSRI